ncbi:MAG TPA: YicC/YloC family endoribonuclease [Ideonella sp.]|uniref:YicC/YloC family endoribonuclease n=1 Tax=Ideonella sp. TaxID=1929293 RepID=UPI002E348931|nr:YicC/YloC family endoribonuclease [Ideonella sp.]HEX5683303.1 YicC/YloC family endoribonuclease [Ideonella sp.]
MPVYSMTGFASASAAPVAEGEAHPAGVTVEMRTVNSRFLDIAFRLPDELRQVEPALRELLTAGLRRGKVEVRALLGRSADEGLPQPSTEQLNRMARIESTVQGWLPSAVGLSVHEALQWCRGGGSSNANAGLDELAVQAARNAIEALREARAREGERLKQILTERLTTLRQLAEQAAPLVPAVVQKQQQRFMERWTEALASAGAAGAVSAEAARDRALNEAAAYAIRIDVAEELSRLQSHLDEIERLLAKGGEVGKRLDFLIQELHREANTLGSKSSALELTGISVDMKVAIEQMREQVQNIE